MVLFPVVPAVSARPVHGQNSLQVSRVGLLCSGSQLLFSKTNKHMLKYNKTWNHQYVFKFTRLYRVNNKIRYMKRRAEDTMVYNGGTPTYILLFLVYSLVIET